MPKPQSENPFKKIPLEVQMEYAESVKTSDASDRVALELQKLGLPMAETLRSIVIKVLGVPYEDATNHQMMNIEKEEKYQDLSAEEKILLAFMKLSHNYMIFRLEDARKQENTKEE